MSTATSFAPRACAADKTIFECLEDPRATAALPSLNSVLLELAALTKCEAIRIDEITQLVEADPGMTMRVLRMSNSAYYAPIEPILNVQEAILYIGLSNVREAVVSARCVEKTCHIGQSIFEWKDFWDHAMGVGRLTMELAAHWPRLDMPAQSFYLMGLLHDIGKVVLAQLMPDAFDEIYSRAALERVSPDSLEMERLGISHAHLGSWYLQKQGISPILSDPVRFHHGYVLDDKSHLRHALLISLADHLARWFQIGKSGNEVEAEDPFVSDEWKWYAAQCGVSEEDDRDLQQEIIDRAFEIRIWCTSSFSTNGEIG